MSDSNIDKRAKILKTLEALLNINTSRGATQAEMEVALSKATSLAFKHRINLDDIRTQAEQDDGSRRVSQNLIARRVKVLEADAHLFIVDILMKYFGVLVCNMDGKGDVEIVGTETDVDFSLYVYSYLRVTFRKLWVVEKAMTLASEGSRKSYYLGVWQALSKKLSQEKVDMEEALRSSDCTAIVLVDEHEAALKRKMQEAVPGMKLMQGKVSARDGEALANGREAGKASRSTRLLVEGM